MAIRGSSHGDQLLRRRRERIDDQRRKGHLGVHLVPAGDDADVDLVRHVSLAYVDLVVGDPFEEQCCRARLLAGLEAERGADGRLQVASRALDGETGLVGTDERADALVVCAGVGSRQIASMLGDRLNVYPVKGYSITVHLDDDVSVANAPWVSLLDESAKIVTSRLGAGRFRVAGTAEFNGYNRDIRADRILPLVAWTRRNFRIDTSRVVPWAGLRPMMPDMMPRVAAGRSTRVFYNTGHGHLGWTLSAATAAIIGRTIAEHHPALG